MDLLHLPMLCAHAGGAEAHRLCVSVLCVSVGAQSQPLVLAWDNDERGVSKAYRPHSRAFGFKAGQDHLRLLASPAQDSKAGTPVDSGGQGGGGAELRSDGVQGQVGKSDAQDLRQGRPCAAIEVVAHNVKDLRSGKIRDKLPELLKRMREMLVRFLGTVQAAHLAFLDEGAFERWSKPTQRGTRRLAGIDLNKARNRHVMDAVVALSTRHNGFTVAQLAEAVRQRSGQD